MVWLPEMVCIGKCARRDASGREHVGEDLHPVISVFLVLFYLRFWMVEDWVFFFDDSIIIYEY